MDKYPSAISKLLAAVPFSVWTAEEKALVDEWLAQDVNNQVLLDRLREKEEVKVDIVSFDGFDVDAAWQHQLTYLVADERASKMKSLVWKRLLYIAASIVIILSASAVLFLGKEQPESTTLTAIAPGTNQAELKLADGTVLALSSAHEGVQIGSELAYDNGESIAVADASKLDVSTFEMRTPRGGQYRMTLPDGSRMWVNADTWVRYEENEQQRKVEMRGEAYFEVQTKQLNSGAAKGEKKPFVVEANGQKVSVVGTSFNVKSYAEDRKSFTTLIEGRVDVTAPSGQHLPLQAGEQSVLNGQQLSKKMVDLNAVLGWKDGMFIFTNDRLDDILSTLGRWYDVEFDVKGVGLNEERFEGMLPRFGDLSDFLKLLEKTGKVKFQQRENIIYVK